MPWQRIEPTTLEHWDNAPTNLVTWPGPHNLFFDVHSSPVWQLRKPQSSEMTCLRSHTRGPLWGWDVIPGLYDYMSSAVPTTHSLLPSQMSWAGVEAWGVEAGAHCTSLGKRGWRPRKPSYSPWRVFLSCQCIALALLPATAATSTGGRSAGGGAHLDFPPATAESFLWALWS